MPNYIKSFDGTRIYYDYHVGTPPTLVFLHGVGGNWTVWKKEIKFFQNKGYSTLALDLRGHGLSDAPKPFNKYQMPHFSQDIYGILNKEGITDFVLIGHSLGGAVAINYCMLHSKKLPTSLILVESASVYPFDHERMLNYGPYTTHLLRYISKHGSLRRRHLSHLEDLDLSEHGIKFNLHLISYLLHLTPLCSMVKTLDNVEKYFFKNQNRIESCLHNLPIPLLVLAGGHDKIVPPKFAFRIKKLVKNAELKLFKKADHHITIDHPQQVSHTILSFLQNKLHVKKARKVLRKVKSF